jgi:signal transduction histidine kinase
MDRLMRSLSAKLAALLALAFMLICSLLVVVTQTMLDPARLFELSGYVVIGSVSFALLAALCVFQLFTRRIKKLAAAVEALQQGDFSVPLRVPGADAQGDEIERLGAHVEMMSARIASQLAELERVASRRRELLANVSHDLRTPLTSMQGYLETLLMRHGSLDPTEERNYLETAARHSERLGRLVSELFELTKLDAGEVTPRLEDFLPAELAHDIAQKFSLDAQQRQVSLNAASVDGRLSVHADIGMVERVLENLVENALRHTPPGGSVSIELSRSAQRARVVVRDTGKGIAKEDLPSVFERYYRANRSAPGGHVGLGLEIARRIVRLHGGDIVVESEVGRGASFCFDLPLSTHALYA